MIRVYLDWNIISNLKRPEYKAIREFIEDNKRVLLFPYSPAHFQDLMKSYSPENDYFQQDLNTLQDICGKHLLMWEDNMMTPKFALPNEYFKGEKDKEDVVSLMNMEKILSDLDQISEDSGLPKFGEVLKGLFRAIPAGIKVEDEHKEEMQKFLPNITSDSNMWDVMMATTPFMQNLLQNRSYYLDLRKTLETHGFKLETNSGNWKEEEVIYKIDEFLAKVMPEMTFMNYVEKTFESRKEPPTKFDFYTSSYLMLDMLGYKSDKLPKQTDTMQNIQADGLHSFYGAHCDFIVAGDKNLRAKSKALYNYSHLSTKVLSPEEFIPELDKAIYKYSDTIVGVLNDAFNYRVQENVINTFPISEEETTAQYILKLPNFYWNYFNYAIYIFLEEQKCQSLTFFKEFENYSGFNFYTETETLLDTFANIFGITKAENFDVQRQEFIEANPNAEFRLEFAKLMVTLYINQETRLPELKIVFFE